MSEFNTRFPEGKRTPIVEVDLGRIVFKFGYDNTWLVAFKNQYQEDEPDDDYSHMNYIIHRHEGGERIFINDSAELFEQLDELGYPMIRRPYPSEEDFDEYARYQVSQLDDELRELGQ